MVSIHSCTSGTKFLSESFKSIFVETGLQTCFQPIDLLCYLTTNDYTIFNNILYKL